MKFLFVTEYYPALATLDFKGGVENRAYYVSQLLGKKDQVSVYACWEIGKPRRQKLGNVTVHRVGIAPRGYYRRGGIIPRLIFILSVLIKGFGADFDLIEGSGLISWLPSLLLAKIKGKKCVAVIADTAESYARDAGILYPLIRIWERAVLKGPWDGYIAISNTVKEKLIRIGIPEKHIRVIFCGVDIDQLKINQTRKNKLMTICTISRLVPYKRIGDLIVAIGMLKNNIPEIRLHLIGSGEDYILLKRKAETIGVVDNVVFHGHINSHRKVLDVLGASDVFCLPSVIEGFGIATIEALSLRVPAVIADIRVNREITQGKGVLFFKPRNIEDLYSKLKQLLTTKNLYLKLKDEALDVASQYDWKKIVTKTEKYYAALCNY